jgi:hexosaminidase
VISVIPRPARCFVGSGSSPVGGRWSIAYADPRLHQVARTARALIAPHCPGLEEQARFEAGGEPEPAGTVRRLRFTLAAPDEWPARPRALGEDPSGDPKRGEGYCLAVDASGITCSAPTARGLMRAAASAAQLLGTTVGGELAHQVLDDAPRFAWRGLMVDPARCFLTTDDLRRLIDLAALYKLNVLHLHLTDNEAWRVEVPGWPRLTDLADDGWYGLAEFRELQRYAADRYVTVVPEVDLPGHCAAAVRAYPELGTVPAPASLPAAVAAALARPLDPGDAFSRRFIEEVYAAISAETQGRYVHIGGDEVFGMAAAPFAAAVRLARTAVRAAGREPVGWQEAARAGSGPGDVSQFWVDARMADLPTTREEYEARPEFAAAGLTMDIVRRLAAHMEPAGEDLVRAVEGGGSVLLSPQSHLYLDRPYDPVEVPAPHRDRVRRLGFPTYRPQSIREAAGWNPADHGVAEARVAGVEATLFGSTLRSFEDACTLLLPRLPGVAEAAWAGSLSPWPEYRLRLGAHAALWRKRDLPYLSAAGVDWA